MSSVGTASGANGNPLIKTPSLDRLAAQSANFTYAFVQAPVCVPSRASYFTGRYPHCHRNRVNYTPLDRSEVLMQARLKSAGYATASVGKLHYYPPTPEEARRTGFDFVELHDGVRFTDEWSDYAKWRQQNDPQAANYYYRNLAKDVKPGENPFRAAIDERFCETTWTGERTRHYLKQLAGQDKPFFLFCSFWKPHPSFEVPSPFSEMYNGVEIPLPEPATLAADSAVAGALAGVDPAPAGLRHGSPPPGMGLPQLLRHDQPHRSRGGRHSPDARRNRAGPAHDRRLRLGPRRPDARTRADGQELLLRGVGPRAADDPPAGPRAARESTTNWWKPSI